MCAWSPVDLEPVLRGVRPAPGALNVITGPGEPSGQALIRALVQRDAVEEFLAAAEMIGTIVSFQLEPNWPFGGYRQSGLGREGGRAAVESYTELKTVLLPFTDEMM